MQISRHVLVTCAVATFLIPTFLHAYDNEAQIRARQALEEKMKQAETQAPPATSAPPAAVSQPPAAPAVPQAKPSTADNDRLRQALDEKMKEMQTQTPAAPPAEVTKPAPAKKTAAPAPKQTPSAVTTTPKPAPVENPSAQTAPAFAPEISQPATPAPAAPAMSAPAVPVRPANNAENDKLSEALHQKMRETEAEPMVTPAPPQKENKPAPAVVKAAPAPAPVASTPQATTPAPTAPTATAPAYAPIPETSNVARPTLPETPTPQPEPAPAVSHKQPAQPVLNLPALSGPPSSLSSAKQQKLDALLQQYKMDQLTPQQYHEQRAKILSEP